MRQQEEEDWCWVALLTPRLLLYLPSSLNERSIISGRICLILSDGISESTSSVRLEANITAANSASHVKSSTCIRCRMNGTLTSFWRHSAAERTFFSRNILCGMIRGVWASRDDGNDCDRQCHLHGDESVSQSVRSIMPRDERVSLSAQQQQQPVRYCTPCRQIQDSITSSSS